MAELVEVVGSSSAGCEEVWSCDVCGSGFEGLGVELDFLFLRGLHWEEGYIRLCM